jgi:hypothetical protein
MLTKLEQFILDVLRHTFTNIETEIVYVSEVKGVPKNKIDGRIVPDKFQGLVKYSYRKVGVGLSWDDALKLAHLCEGKSTQYPAPDITGWEAMTTFLTWAGLNTVVRQHYKTKTISIPVIWHGKFPFDTKGKSIYMTADGRELSKEEVTEFYSYMGNRKQTKYDLTAPPEYRNYNVTKIKYFKNGSLVFNDLTSHILDTLKLK